MARFYRILAVGVAAVAQVEALDEAIENLGLTVLELPPMPPCPVARC